MIHCFLVCLFCFCFPYLFNGIDGEEQERGESSKCNDVEKLTVLGCLNIDSYDLI